MQPFSLYVHFPYCAQKCPYCDFNTFAVASFPEDEYISALVAELKYFALQPGWIGGQIQTVYFGGGTPSLFKPGSIRRFMREVELSFSLGNRLEVSIEVNPGTLTEDGLKGYLAAGVNRVSIGVQSFSDRGLKSLGRTHSSADALRAIEMVQAQRVNFSIDLMYGTPNQTQVDFAEDLRRAVSIKPNHISAYGLTIEPGTEFFSSFKKGNLPLPDEECVLEMMELLNQQLAAAGYQHYEISNFAQPGFEARHNLAYWNRSSYLGLGAGAHSFLKSSGDWYGERHANIGTPKLYIEAAKTRGESSAWREKLDRKAGMYEFFFLGLRKIAGIGRKEFLTEFGCGIEAAYPGIVEALIEGGFLEESDLIRLSPKGLALADSVISNFAPVNG